MPEFYLNEDLIDGVRDAIDRLRDELHSELLKHENGSQEYQESNQAYDVNRWLSDTENQIDQLETTLLSIKYQP